MNNLAEETTARNIGLNIQPPSQRCKDPNCPFHGSLPVRGQVITTTVMTKKMMGTIAVQREFKHYVKKYERYEKRTSKYLAHLPPCIKVEVGDEVRIAECRPLSKSVSFVVIENTQQQG